MTLTAPVNAALGSPSTIAVGFVDDENVLAIPTLSPLTMLLLTALLAGIAVVGIEQS